MRKIIVKIIKVIIGFALNLYLKSVGHLLFELSKQYTRFHVHLIHLHDWKFTLDPPSHYKHVINLYKWIYEPEQVEFIASGALPRTFMKEGSNVLDLCSGDGSISYLFFSDVAESIDSIDNDVITIEYAQKNYARSNIRFIYGDILTYDFDKKYDFVNWVSGVAYFTKKERANLFSKIASLLSERGVLFIRTPWEKNVTISANQKQVITNDYDFELEFYDYFVINQKIISEYCNRCTLNYVLSKRE